MPVSQNLPSPSTSTSAPVFRRAASLADVAHLAGVSAGTVSRALSKPEMISEATRLRVLDAVERLGYVANGAARALAMRRTMTVGAIVPRFGSSSFAATVQALEATLAREAYTLLLSAPDPRPLYETSILRAMLERGVDAVVLLGVEQPPQVLAMLATHRTPFAMMWAPPDAKGHGIGFDEQAAGALAIAHLAELGHRCIGYIGGCTADSELARRRLQGLSLAISRHGLTLWEGAHIETPHGFREGFDAMVQIMQRRTPITAMVCGSDYLAAGALAALDQAGVAVPARMSVVSFNDNDFAPYLHPPLTTVHLPIREIGEKTGQSLIARLRDLAVPPVATLPVALVRRSSTGPVPV